MSRSPYRKNVYNNQKRELSPYREETSKLAEKSRLGHSYIAEQPTPEKRAMPSDESFGYRFTEKRRIQSQPKIETLLEQNKFLLIENNQLTSLLNDRSRVILALEKKLEEQIAQEVHTLEEIQMEKNRFLSQYSKKVQQYNVRNQRLMDEIAQLNEDLYQLESVKNKQIQILKENFTRQHKVQLENILTNHAQTVQLMQLENSKMKDIVQERDQELDRLGYQLKQRAQRYEDEIKGLEKEIEHCLHLKKLQLSDQKIKFENTIQNLKRQAKKDQEISTAQYENQLMRIRNEVVARQIEIEKLSNDLETGKIETQIKVTQLNDKRQALEKEIVQLQDFQKTLIFQETQRIKDMAKAEVENMENTNNQLLDALKNENQRLVELNNTKSNEVIKLYLQIETARNKHQNEIESQKRQIQELKDVIEGERKNDQEETEMFKTKVAHLRNADISSLRNYYENEMTVLLQDSSNKDIIIQENRSKLHHEIQEKTQMRKTFDIQIAKLQVRIGQLELKLMNTVNEKKQQLASFGSQMQLTSMSFLRHAQQKEKYTVFSHSEKRKLQKMIEDKDRQIENLNQKIKMLQSNHAKEVSQKNDEIDILKKTIEELQNNLKKQKYFLENQIKKKESIHKNDKEFYESEISRIKRESSNEYNKLLNQLSTEKNNLQIEKSQLKDNERRLAEELALVKEQREQEGLNSQIALHEEKQRLNTSKQILEINLTSYYKKQLESRTKEIDDLRQELKEKDEDIRSHMLKQKGLEEKIEKLLQSQQRLREVEEKVINMGQENNLIKNLSEIVKSRRR